jgi:hypothetical protein
MTVYLGDIRLDSVAVGPVGPEGPTGPAGPQGTPSPTNVIVVPNYTLPENITGTFSNTAETTGNSGWYVVNFDTRTMPKTGYVFLRLEANPKTVSNASLRVVTFVNSQVAFQAQRYGGLLVSVHG